MDTRVQAGSSTVCIVYSGFINSNFISCGPPEGCQRLNFSRLIELKEFVKFVGFFDLNLNEMNHVSYNKYPGCFIT